MPNFENKARKIDFFGEFTWANFLEWLVTFCLGGILMLTALQLGGVRPETQLKLQPLYIVLLVLHGLSMAASRPEQRKFYLLPFFFIPFLVWAFASVMWWTPTPWRGSYELNYFITAFIFGWVAVNSVRTRSQLWTLLIMSLIPVGQAIFIGYYQFFQNPKEMAGVLLGYPVELSAQYLGQATGVFADPGSFAAFLLILTPSFMVAAFVPRLPVILRFLSFYVTLILVVGIALAQVYWAAATVILILAIVPWFCFEAKKRRSLFSLLGAGSAVIVLFGMYVLSPVFERGLSRALSVESEGIRLVLWEKALDFITESPVTGSGAGSFSLQLEQSSDFVLARLPLTPHNDFLLILSNYGLVGGFLAFLPLLIIIYYAFRRWRQEPYKLKTLEGYIMPSTKFFLGLAICGVLACILCAATHFVAYVPVLLLYSVLMGSILVKFSFSRAVTLPGFRFFGPLYFLTCATLGFTFWAHSSLRTESKGLELEARQRLDVLVERGIGISGNFRLVDQVIALYEDALIADPENADAWIGLSMAVCQLHYRDPADFEDIGERAAQTARRAYEICPEYWLASAQLGVASALEGEIDAAGEALERAIRLAPNVSNAHYYYAAFLAADNTMRKEAIERVRRALEIDPGNVPARRLEQKLLIL